MLITELPHTSHPEHKLKLVKDETPYTCDGCFEIGFGSRYRCKQCNFDLHKDCMSATSSKSHSFYKKCNFKLLEKPIGERFCDACGSDIKGISYHCAKYGRDLHPCCSNLPNKITLEEVELHLSEKLSSKCGWCSKKKVQNRVTGWSYAFNNCNFHISCIREMLVKIWERGYFSRDEQGDNLTLERSNSNIQQIALYSTTTTRWEGLRKYLKIAKLIIKVIISTILGDPSPAMVWLAESLFSS